MSKIAPIKFVTKTGEEIIIRSPKINDFEEFNRHLEKTSTESIFTNEYPGQPKKNKIEILKKWKTAEETTENCFLLAFYKNKVVGRIKMSCINTHPWLKKTAEFSLSVNKSFWEKGIGGKLSDLLISEFKKAKLRRLEAQCDSENFRGLSLYLKKGFKVEAIHYDSVVINNQYRDRYRIALINNQN